MTIVIIDITFRGLLIVLTCLLGYHFPDLRKSIVPKLSVFAADLTENLLVVLRPAQSFCGVAVVVEPASPGGIDLHLASLHAQQAAVCQVSSSYRLESSA
jgi:hypothetical protein